MAIDVIEKYVDQIVIEKPKITEIQRCLGAGNLVGNSVVGANKLALCSHGRIKIDGIASEVISVWIFEPNIAVTLKLMECCEFDAYEDLCVGTLYLNPNAAHGLYERLFGSKPDNCFVQAAKNAHEKAFG